MTNETNLWPYCERSGLIDRDLARSIREWALTEMTEAELRSYSQRQLMQMYIQRHLGPTLERVLGRSLPSDLEAAKVVLENGPLTPKTVIKAMKEARD
jgi:hypothetical protein